MAKKEKNESSNGQAKPKSWFKYGDEGYNEMVQREKATSLMKEKSVSRFRLEPGEEATIIFLDDVGCHAKIHQIEFDGRWGNFLTCTKDAYPCAVCNSTGRRPVYTVHYTIIDTREFTRKDGTKVKNRRIIFPAKGVMAHQLYDLKKKYGSLVGRAFKVKRYSKEDISCGSTITHIGKVDFGKLKIPQNDLKPYDYEKVLAFPTEEELAYYGFMGSVVAGSPEDIKDEDLADLSKILD